MTSLNKPTTITLVNNGSQWIVYNGPNISNTFWSIEYAAGFMIEAYKINDDDIDDALCFMAGYEHDRAIFKDGRLSHTEASNGQY